MALEIIAHLNTVVFCVDDGRACVPRWQDRRLSGTLARHGYATEAEVWQETERAQTPAKSKKVLLYFREA